MPDLSKINVNSTTYDLRDRGGVRFDSVQNLTDAQKAMALTNIGAYYILNQLLDHRIYGFHIDSSESSPSACVTYLGDATGFTPAYMDYTNNVFRWGSWKNAFFLPRPCMLKYDGTVDYYLDPDDYTKKADGTASDVADDTYAGNAMMEWGRDGKRIWVKIVPDSGDNTSASVYIADYKADSDYRAWSFINHRGALVDHFYTPIYNGSLDSGGRLRSISGKAYTALCQGRTAEQEVTAAEANNPSTDKLWYTEVYSDIILINLLLILIGKSTDTQAVFGNGVVGKTASAENMLATGTMDDKGMFWGSNTNDYGVKVFGMENWWGNQWRRYAGHVMVDFQQKYKLTRGTADGSTSADYVQSGTASDYAGYLVGAELISRSNNFIRRMAFDAYTFQQIEHGGTSASSSTYWCDYGHQASGVNYAARGGACNTSALRAGAFCCTLSNPHTDVGWYFGAAPSCKPLAA